MSDFIHEYWVIIALIISELLSFVPAKYNGIAQSVFKILSLIFGKKERTAINATNRKTY